MFATFDIDKRIRVTDYSELLDGPIWLRIGAIDGEAIDMLRKAITAAHASSQGFLPVVLHSGGGDVYSCLAMSELISESPIPVYTIVDGVAASCAAVLFSAGTKRYMGREATIMIHDVVHISPDADEKRPEEHAMDAHETGRLSKKLMLILDRNCGKPRGYFRDVIHEAGHADVYINAKKAIFHGLATHVGLPILRTRITVDMTMEDK